jgi:death-on-curing protein
VNNHPLVDGNDVLAWIGTTVFLRLNDHEPFVDDDEAFSLVSDIASGSLELSEIARRLGVRATT